MISDKKQETFPADPTPEAAPEASALLKPDPAASAGKSASTNSGPFTLAVDIGGSSMKASVLDRDGNMVADRARVPTPRPATPAAILQALGSIIRNLPAYDRISIGFPGMVRDGMVLTAPNLGTDEWANFALAEAAAKQFGKPARVANDADVQGLGVVAQKGLEVVLTLGTGIGSAIFKEGQLMPHLELGQHPIRKGKTYDEYLGHAAFEEIGPHKWNKRLRRVIETVRTLTNFDVLHLGGGNTKYIKGDLPGAVRIAQNIGGITGGLRLWDASSGQDTAKRPATSR